MSLDTRLRKLETSPQLGENGMMVYSFHEPSDPDGSKAGEWAREEAVRRNISPALFVGLKRYDFEGTETNKEPAFVAFHPEKHR